MKYLLITSDDFGMTLSVNRGIERALLDGVVGATNLMVPCPWFADAVRRVKEHGLSAGIHLTLTSEWDLYRWGPLTSGEQLRAVDGRFHRAYEQLPLDLSPDEIRAEFNAQLAAFRSTGLEPTHVDTHMISSSSASPTEKKVKSVVRQLCADEELIYTYDTADDGSLLHFDSETLATPISRDDLRARLSELGEGVHHVISHCAVSGSDLSAMCSDEDPARPWADELRMKDHDLLTDPATRHFIDEKGFQLLTMQDFLTLVR